MWEHFKNKSLSKHLTLEPFGFYTDYSQVTGIIQWLSYVPGNYQKQGDTYSLNPQSQF